MADEDAQAGEAQPDPAGGNDEPAATVPPSQKGALREVAFLFLRLGVTDFGGPAAHIALMRDEVVKRRQWISDERFVDLWGTCNLIPGPTSTELAIYLGYQRAGWPGLIVGGICFIGPAMLIVLALAWAYVAFGSLPQVAWLFYGIKPVVVAIIAYALWGLSRTALANIDRSIHQSCHNRCSIQFTAALSHVSQNRRGTLRQRICLTGVSAQRFCVTFALAYGPPIARCCFNRSIYARPRIHYCHLHRLRRRRSAWRVVSNAGHFSALIPVHCACPPGGNTAQALTMDRLIT